jgi:hypothetical protein
VTGKGAPVGVKVWACEAMKYVDVKMKDVENRDFTVTKIEILK